MKLLCATGNDAKFAMAHRTCEQYGISLEQVVTDSAEIQSEDPVTIVERKAQDAFALLKQPVLVSDDSWAIAGLKGFPGAYMKSVNYWFTPEDFIRLTKELVDRQVVLHQYLAYCDGKETVVFNQDATGQLLTEPRGKAEPSSAKVVAMDYDNGLSIAEIYDQGREDSDERIAGDHNVWQQFAVWYRDNKL